MAQLKNTLINGTASITDALTVSGSAQFNQQVNIAGAANIGGTAIFSSNVYVTGSEQFISASEFRGPKMNIAEAEFDKLTVGNNGLIVSGNATLKNPVEFESTIDVAGATTLHDNLTVSGAADITGNAVVEGDATVKGNQVVSGALHTIGNAQIDGDAVVAGNLTVQGAMTVIETEDLKVKDKYIEIASGSTTAAAVNGAGIKFGDYVASGSTGPAELTYDSTNDTFEFNKPITQVVELSASIADAIDSLGDDDYLSRVNASASNHMAVDLQMNANKINMAATGSDAVNIYYDATSQTINFEFVTE